MSVPTDGAAIAASLKEPRAFEELFDRHFRRVYGFLRQQVGPADAEDLTAETFARAFDARRKFDLHRESAAPWLLGIAHNVAREHYRRREPVLEPPQPLAEPNGDHSAALDAALRSLNGSEREALLLFAWGELTYEEIAETQGVLVGTVRSRLSRAREHVRARLENGIEREDVVCDG